MLDLLLLRSYFSHSRNDCRTTKRMDQSRSWKRYEFERSSIHKVYFEPTADRVTLCVCARARACMRACVRFHHNSARDKDSMTVLVLNHLPAPRLPLPIPFSLTLRSCLTRRCCWPQPSLLHRRGYSWSLCTGPPARRIS